MPSLWFGSVHGGEDRGSGECKCGVRGGVWECYPIGLPITGESPLISLGIRRALNAVRVERSSIQPQWLTRMEKFTARVCVCNLYMGMGSGGIFIKKKKYSVFGLSWILFVFYSMLRKAVWTKRLWIWSGSWYTDHDMSRW